MVVLTAAAVERTHVVCQTSPRGRHLCDMLLSLSLAAWMTHCICVFKQLNMHKQEQLQSIVTPYGCKHWHRLMHRDWQHNIPLAHVPNDIKITVCHSLSSTAVSGVSWLLACDNKCDIYSLHHGTNC